MQTIKTSESSTPAPNQDTALAAVNSTTADGIEDPTVFQEPTSDPIPCDPVMARELELEDNPHELPHPADAVRPVVFFDGNEVDAAPASSLAVSVESSEPCGDLPQAEPNDPVLVRLEADQEGTILSQDPVLAESISSSTANSMPGPAESVRRTKRSTPSVRRRECDVLPGNKPTCAPPHGSWSFTQVSLDSQGANTLGIALRPAMTERGLKPFERGDRVSILVFVNGAAHEITGRASRPWTAFYRVSDLAAIGLEVHTPIYVSVTSVNGQVPTAASTNVGDATQNGAPISGTPNSADVGTQPEGFIDQIGTAHSVSDTGGHMDGEEAGVSNEPRRDLIPFDAVLDRNFEAEDNPLDLPDPAVAARLGALFDDDAEALKDAESTTSDDDELGSEPDESCLDLDLPPEPRF